MRYLIVLFCLAFCACASSPDTKKTSVDNATATTNIDYIRSVDIISPIKHEVYKLNSKISFNFSIKDDLKTDSVEVFFDGDLIKTLKSAPFTFEHTFINSKLGDRQIKAIAYHDNNKRGLAVTNISLLPSEAPINRSYKIVKTYSHDTGAFTQGLTFHDGFLYEGTGQRGESCIKKIDLKTNKPVSILDIDKDLFGEGICVYKDKIIQLTYTSGRGFVYDINSFSKESEFTYSTQGWGITTVGDDLIMSDGTNKLYYLDPLSFGIKSQIEVYDDKGAVDQLNELEYIKGLIYANVWMTDRIVVIDPATGRVVESINMSGLISEAERRAMDDTDDVLNGIAYDVKGDRLFVTGKRWPKLFQIIIK